MRSISSSGVCGRCAGSFVQQRGQQVAHGRGNGGGQIIERRRFLKVPLPDLRERTVKNRLARQHGPERGPQGIEVRPDVQLAIAPDLLRAGVMRGAEEVGLPPVSPGDLAADALLPVPACTARSR